jgi:5-methylthioadenosine/S-adenosylhomocysteine deaminase
MYDPFSHLVFSARAADVRHAMIRGRVVVRNRKLETIDLEGVLAAARAAASRMRSR